MKEWKTYHDATSTIEAEFVAYFKAVIQSLWLWNSILGLWYSRKNNYAFVFFSKNDKYSKLMDLNYFSVKEDVQKQKVSFEHIDTNLMIEGLLTKRFVAQYIY